MKRNNFVFGLAMLLIAALLVAFLALFAMKTLSSAPGNTAGTQVQNAEAVDQARQAVEDLNQHQNNTETT